MGIRLIIVDIAVFLVCNWEEVIDLSQADANKSRIALEGSPSSAS